MTFLNQLDTIDAQLNRVLQVNKHLRASGTMTHLESDLIREYLRRLYEMYDALEEVRPPAVTSRQATPEKIPPVAEAPEVQPEVPQEETPTAPVVEPEIVQPAQVEAEVVKPVQVEVAPKVEPAPEAAAEENAPEPDEEPIQLLEKFKKPTEVVKEVNAKGASIKSLKELIPLNDKFVFIREFFGNSLTRYDETLKELEALGDRKAIGKYLEQQVFTPEIMTRKEELVQRFTDIIDRKYGA